MSLLNRLVWPLCIALAFSIGMFWRGATAQEEKGKSVQKWEYAYGSGYSQKHVTEMGLDGWELVAVTAPSPSIPGDLSATFYFKRPK